MKVKTIIKGVINFFGDYYCTLCMGTVYLKYFGWLQIFLIYFKKFS